MAMSVPAYLTTRSRMIDVPDMGAEKSTAPERATPHPMLPPDRSWEIPGQPKESTAPLGSTPFPGRPLGPSTSRPVSKEGKTP
jgi:hypothetical protein